MKKFVVILSLMFLGTAALSQSTVKSSDTTAVNKIPITDTTLVFSVEDLDKFITQVGNSLGDYLTKNQWEVVKNIIVREASVMLQQSVQRYGAKNLPGKSGKK